MPNLLSPSLHGAAGPYDELINLIPLAIGSVLILYLYLDSHKRRRPENEEQAQKPEPPPDDSAPK